MKMKAYRLKQVDKQYEMHYQAWINQQVKATKNIGTEKKPKHVPVFKSFKEFFDYDKAIKEAGNEKESLSPKQKKLARIASMANGKGVKHG